jgi:hypothetical protein
MTPAQLPAPLRAGARGIPTEEAAIGLLVAHRAWLDRADFARFIVTTWSAVDPPEGTAIVDWPAAISALDAGALPCSAGERHMLRLAASLTDYALIHLGDAITSLDSTNTQILIEAILHADGDRK